jgi:hypothetical protein
MLMLVALAFATPPDAAPAPAPLLEWKQLLTVSSAGKLEP